MTESSKKKRQRQGMETSVDDDNNAEQWTEIEELDAVMGEARDEDRLEGRNPDDLANCLMYAFRSYCSETVKIKKKLVTLTLLL